MRVSRGVGGVSSALFCLALLPIVVTPFSVEVYLGMDRIIERIWWSCVLRDGKTLDKGPYPLAGVLTLTLPHIKQSLLSYSGFLKGLPCGYVVQDFLVVMYSALTVALLCCLKALNTCK